MKSKNRSIQLSRIFIENGFNIFPFWRLLKKRLVNDFILSSYISSHPNTIQKCRETHSSVIFHSDFFLKHSEIMQYLIYRIKRLITNCVIFIVYSSFLGYKRYSTELYNSVSQNNLRKGFPSLKRQMQEGASQTEILPEKLRRETRPDTWRPKSRAGGFGRW